MAKKNPWVEYPIPGQTYRHYKGGLYKVISMSTDSETGKPYVVYESLLFGSILHRPLEMWFEEIPDVNQTRFTLEEQ